MPAMMRLRLGKLCASAGVPSGNSEMTRPAFADRSSRPDCLPDSHVDTGADDRDRGGVTVAASAPRCAAASMPSASPLTIVTPPRASAAQRPRHWRCPAESRCGCRRWPLQCVSSSSRPIASAGGGSTVSSSPRILGIGERHQRVLAAACSHCSVASMTDWISALGGAASRRASGSGAAHQRGQPRGKDLDQAGRSRADGARCAGRGRV